MMLAAGEDLSSGQQLIVSLVVFVSTTVAIWLGALPFKKMIRRREEYYASVLGGSLLLSIKPRSVTILTAVLIVFLAMLGYWVTGNEIGILAGILLGIWFPMFLIRYLRAKRLRRLEEQLVGGIQTLASGVRAGLNLVQAMELVARDGPIPLRQEFAHLLREYEYGLSLEDAMNNAACRIGSGDYRLLFGALLTHRERGGDLGLTLDRIADSIREIQRLESRVDALTAQGRATARALGAMPGIVLAILYFLVDSNGVNAMFTTLAGKVLLLIMVTLNIIGFLWIRKIMDIDV